MSHFNCMQTDAAQKIPQLENVSHLTHSQIRYYITVTWSLTHKLVLKKYASF